MSLSSFRCSEDKTIIARCSWSSFFSWENLTERQIIIERRERLKAATLYVLRRPANETLPRPPDPQAKCYLSGADDIRPALFRALPC